ncbi:hypothetical protein BCR44DRAFT_1446068 [Catenaria anguillulae PL171]|uniref:Uncharacterized protein n=1 Tax=Catenaria anguillulae PL171 TaxID=765915 RepID=A0A1Y2H6E4_9FUNG|nr:hypothetical protein BCR44DRAFT_1446068 [Catenaria anguillulae PL171]
MRCGLSTGATAQARLALGHWAAPPLVTFWLTLKVGHHVRACMPASSPCPCIGSG